MCFKGAEDFTVNLPLYDGEPYSLEKKYKLHKVRGLQLIPSTGTRVAADTVILAGYDPYCSLSKILAKIKVQNNNNNAIDGDEGDEDDDNDDDIVS